MATLVTGEALHAAVRGETFIRNGDAKAVDSVKYDLRLGSTVLKASIGLPKALDQMQDGEQWIDPGEVVFVLTQEELHLPKNMIATLSPKRALTHRGVMVLGGFAIDPGYQGNLWFGLYNFASARYPLRTGTKLIACMFYELSEEEANKYECVPMESVTQFPDDLLDLVKNYKPIELKGIQEEVASIKREFVDLKQSVTEDKSWKDEFRRDLTKLLDGLKEERDSRQAADDKLQGKLDGVSTMFARASVVGYIVAAALGGCGIILIQWLFTQVTR